MKKLFIKNNFFINLNLFFLIITFLFSSNTLKSEKNEVLFGFSIYNDSIDKVVDTNIYKNTSNINGLASTFIYSRYFLDQKMFYRLDFGLDLSFNKTVTSDYNKVTSRVSRKEFTPFMIGPNLTLENVHLYAGFGLTFVNYRLNIIQESTNKDNPINSPSSNINDFIYKLDSSYNVNGLGYTFVLGLVAKIKDKAVFYTELKLFDSSIKSSYSNDLNIVTDNPYNNINSNPFYQRIYFGVGAAY